MPVISSRWLSYAPKGARVWVQGKYIKGYYGYIAEPWTDNKTIGPSVVIEYGDGRKDRTLYFVDAAGKAPGEDRYILLPFQPDEPFEPKTADERIQKLEEELALTQKHLDRVLDKFRKLAQQLADHDRRLDYRRLLIETFQDLPSKPQPTPVEPQVATTRGIIRD